MTIRSYSFVVKISIFLLVVFSFILQILHIPIDPIDHHRNKNHCIDNYGTSGHWYYNETLGRQTFYRGGFRSNRWYQENAINSTAIYPGNAYGWHDNTEQQHCKPIQPVTKDSFCSTMKKLQIKRLLVVGDSLSLVDGQLGSLLALLGYSAWDFFATPKRPIQRDTIECDNETISVQAFRENLGSNLLKTSVDGREDATRDHTQQFGPEIGYCDGSDEGKDPAPNGKHYCPWHKFYNVSEQKSLVLLNQGAHFHSIDSFTRSMRQFVDAFSSIAHSKDIIVFRNTVPGHFHCFELDGIGPTEITYSSFIERYGTTLYDWNLFADYNTIAKEMLEELRLQAPVTTHYLNVYNMTVLRADQHVAATDCLHYTAPGPIDFWNHLLFTNLDELYERNWLR